MLQMHDSMSRACRHELAVSVRTPPRLLRWESGVVLEDRGVEAGRDTQLIERANIMLNDLVQLKTRSKRTSKNDVHGVSRFSCCSSGVLGLLDANCRLRQRLRGMVWTTYLLNSECQMLFR